MRIDISLIKENPLNREIYGDEDSEQHKELVEKIRKSGYIKPLIVTRNYLLLSGHRRYKVALELGRTEIDVEFYHGDDDKELEMLLNENAFREKTTFQKVREAEYYRKIEEKKAEERQQFGVGLGEKFPQGRTNDIVGAKIGMSGKSYEKARKVVNRIDSGTDEASNFFLEDILEESIDAASRLADKSDDFVKMVMERTDGEPSRVSAVIKEIENENKSMKAHLPPGKYQVLYSDLTSNPIVDDFLELPISGIAQDTSVIFLWVNPAQIAKGLQLIEGWGFSYRTCLVWNQEYLKDVNSNFQLLLIGAKGNPIMLFKEPEPFRNGNKPSVIRERIRSTYLGDKVDLEFDESLNGWQIWR